MKATTITTQDAVSTIIQSYPDILLVFERMGIKLGFGNKTIAEIAHIHEVRPDAFTLILNYFCRTDEKHSSTENIHIIPDILRYLKSSHQYYLKEKIPQIHEVIRTLVLGLQDGKATLVESFYEKYVEEFKEHIDYENETVFPYIEKAYENYASDENVQVESETYDIATYSDHHDDIEDVLKDLKNILILHLPQTESGNARTIVLRQLLELESDLNSHTMLEDQVLIPLVKVLQEKLNTRLN